MLSLSSIPLYKIKEKCKYYSDNTSNAMIIINIF